MGFKKLNRKFTISFVILIVVCIIKTNGKQGSKDLMLLNSNVYGLMTTRWKKKDYKDTHKRTHTTHKRTHHTHTENLTKINEN